MPISLSTFASGALVNADVLDLRRQTIERYVNEQIATGDRTTNWLDSVHVYRPDFQYAGVGEMPATGGHFFWCSRPDDRRRAALINSYIGGNAIPVPGLSRTIQIPTGIASNNYRIVTFVNFVAYEWGAQNTTESQDGDAAELTTAFRLRISGSAASAATRRLYTSSQCDGTTSSTGFGYNAAYYNRKYFSMVYADDGTLATGLPGTVNVQVVADMSALAAPTSQRWKHIIVQQGTMYVRCRVL